jgi:hypothetical protein
LPITLDEEIRTLRRAVAWVPSRRKDRATHPSCLFRWAKHGLRGIRLEVIRVGGSLCTSKQALQRFFHRLAEADDPDTSSESTSRQREIAQAGRRAEAALR